VATKSVLAEWDRQRARTQRTCPAGIVGTSGARDAQLRGEKLHVDHHDGPDGSRTTLVTTWPAGDEFAR
jgi:hypothetical protein